MRVQGEIDGARYDVHVGPDGPTGSVRVGRLVAQYTGRQVKAGPTGPMVTVSPSDPASVVALLAVKTRVTGTAGDDDEDEGEAPAPFTIRPGIIR